MMYFYKFDTSYLRSTLLIPYFMYSVRKQIVENFWAVLLTLCWVSQQNFFHGLEAHIPLSISKLGTFLISPPISNLWSIFYGESEILCAPVSKIEKIFWDLGLETFFQRLNFTADSKNAISFCLRLKPKKFI